MGYVSFFRRVNVFCLTLAELVSIHNDFGFLDAEWVGAALSRRWTLHPSPVCFPGRCPTQPKKPTKRCRVPKIKGKKLPNKKKTSCVFFKRSRDPSFCRQKNRNVWELKTFLPETNLSHYQQYQYQFITPFWKLSSFNRSLPCTGTYPRWRFEVPNLMQLRDSRYLLYSFFVSHACDRYSVKKNMLKLGFWNNWR